MRLARFLLAGLLFAPVAASTSAGEIFPIKGESIKGEIVSVSDTEVIYEAAGKKQKKPIKEVLRIEYRETGKLPADAKFAIIELTDGSILYASSYGIKKREVEMKLLSGPTVKVPLATISGILNDGKSESSRRDWKSRAARTRGRSAMVFKRGEIISNIDCTWGEGSADGKSIAAAVDIGGEIEQVKKTLDSMQGLLFKHTLDSKAPVARCQLFDTLGNVVMVSEIKPTATGLNVSTPAGATLEFKNAELSRIDYTKGKLDYLSEMPPLKMVARSNLDEDPTPDQQHVFKDKNLKGGSISLGGVAYKKGLAIKPFTELTYDLKGDYRELSMLVGIDDNVGADGTSILIIEVDGREIATVKIARSDKIRFKPVALNIKDAQKLKITVKSDGDFDTGRHLDLADAKVSK